MAYIWNNYNSSKYFYISAEESPYMETWDSSGKNVGVNIDIRLDDLLLPKEYIGNNDKVINLFKLYEDDVRYRDIFNVICHYVAKTDRLRGVTYRELIEINILNQIENGYFGDKIKQKFRLLSKADQKKVGRYIAKYEYSEGREMQLYDALRYLFEDVNCYYEPMTEINHICINKLKNEYNENLFEVICYFLQDIRTLVSVYWLGEHFGIIGVDETMRIDYAALI